MKTIETIEAEAHELGKAGHRLDAIKTIRQALGSLALAVKWADKHYPKQEDTPPSPAQRQEHTPGPWLLGPYACSSIFASFPDSPGKPVLIADTRNRNHVANARLIAAAPELLEALKAIEAVASKEANAANSISGEMGARISDARAAIAKATGATP